MCYILLCNGYLKKKKISSFQKPHTNTKGQKEIFGDGG